MTVAVAVDAGRGLALADELRQAGVTVAAVTDAALDPRRLDDVLAGADTLVLAASRRTLTATLVARCDRLGVRIVPLCAGAAARLAAESFGLGPVLDADADGWAVADALGRIPEPSDTSHPAPLPHDETPHRVIVVWGGAGAPGRSTLAVELACALARDGRGTCLVDADAHAPSIALQLGLSDEGPGFAAACRQADQGTVDAAELERVSVAVSAGGDAVRVLTGINRPSRWPELSAARVRAALASCRQWLPHTVVDVAGPLESDEEIVSDLAETGPRRNAATLAALRCADHIVAVVGADPLGVARFLREYGELRRVVGSAVPVSVVANRLRPGAMGVDARGQVRRALERFVGITDVWFTPADPRGVDAALLAAVPVAVVAPRSPLAAAVRRFVAEALTPRSSGRRRARHPTARGSKGRRHAGRVVAP